MKNLKATLQKSYYGKAKIWESNGYIILRSYNTDVCAYNPTTNDFGKLWNGYSRTTMNHINDFRLQYGLKALNKKEWENLYSCDGDDYYNVYLSTAFSTHKSTAKLSAVECESFIEKLTKNNPFIYAWFE